MRAIKISISMPNPFPLEAVATFGAKLSTCADLHYMKRAEDELTTYLARYPTPVQRYGGAIGLRGAYGSGKTHLLNWLAERAQESRSIRSAVLYAKADSTHIFDLYRQLISQLDRPTLVERMDLALLELGREHARLAKVTESIASRASARDDLYKLQQEQNLDRPALVDELRNRLLALQVPNDFAKTFMDIGDPVAGEHAYQWLIGDQIPDGSPLGVAQPLGGTDATGAGRTNRDLACIDALELVAALHNIAGVPLIFLVDQLEVLSRTADQARVHTLWSLFKKLVEQLGRQNALLFVAGADEVWMKLPPDVPPRLRRDHPFVVGGLTADETRSLLEAYLAPVSKAFTAEAVERIRDLSGGSPREILRIAHHAWASTEGQLALVTKESLLDSASKSGSIAEQQRSALGIADQILAERGTVSAEVSIGKGCSVDRTLRDERGNIVAALMVLRATDQLSEISAAQQLTMMREYCARHWPGAIVAAVALGYSSSEVLDLLKNAATILEFNTLTFAANLRAWLSEGLSRRAARQEADNPTISSALERLEARLSELESQRSREVENVQARFEQKVAAAAAPARESAELRSRREMLVAVDDLFELMARGEGERERATMHAILVANEELLTNERVEGLGGVFLDALGLERLRPSAPANMLEESHQIRADILSEIRAALRHGTAPKLMVIARVLLPVVMVITGVLSILVRPGKNLAWLGEARQWVEEPRGWAEVTRFLNVDFYPALFWSSTVVFAAATVALARLLFTRAREASLVKRYRLRVARLWGAAPYERLTSDRTLAAYPQARG